MGYGNVHIIRNKIAMYRDFCYKGGGGVSEYPENRVTYYMDVPYRYILYI